MGRIHVRLWAWSAAWLTAILAPGALAAGVASCAPMPVPASGTLQSVAEEMVVNGLPMSIRVMNTAQTPQQVLAFYRAAWPNRPGQQVNVEDRIAPWDVISTRKDGCFYSVQVQQGKRGTIALLGVSRSVDTPAVAGADFPAMAGTRVINDMRSDDLGKVGRLLILSNQFSGSGNATFYRDQMRSSGWTLVKESTPKRGNPQAIVQVFRRGGSWADVSINQGPRGTAVVVNIND